MTSSLLEPDGHNLDRPIDPGPLKELRAALESASKVGKVAIALADESGRQLIEPAQAQGFCREARSHPVLAPFCQRSLLFGLERAFLRNEPFAHFCPFGLLELVVPVPWPEGGWRAAVLSQARCADAPLGLVCLETREAAEALLGDPVLKAFHEAVPKIPFQEVSELGSFLARLLPLIPSGAAPYETGQESPELYSPAPYSPASYSLEPYSPEAGSPEPGSIEAGSPEPLFPEKRFSEVAGLKISSDETEGGRQGLRPKAGRKDAAGAASRLNAAFLISAVGAIANLAVIEGAWKANRMAILLADHLKSSEAATDSDFRPLSEELGDAERYLAIQRLRYGDLLSYRIDSHPSLGELRVPTDSVMPAVERAVICGLAAGGAKLEILVASRAKGREIMVEVADNLTEASWPEAGFENLGFRGASEAGSVARRLNSARERLERLSGGSAGPSFTPSPSGGSVCRLRLPAMALVQAS
ncbi:MAG: PocR ligand-binding domain-containing protein [Deltaproteobacteria bacterium]|jgi:hypothetical protein|nr:PocR ligand-binding domain-containing protein [Deltaproteobacteria bacterium]